MDEREKLAQDRGFPALPNKVELDKHLRWLVQRQVSDHKYTEIARASELSDPEQQGRKTVAAAIKSAADLIGLPLRPPDEGSHPPSNSS